MLTISGLTYRIGGRTLLNEAGAQIPAGNRDVIVLTNAYTAGASVITLWDTEADLDCFEAGGTGVAWGAAQVPWPLGATRCPGWATSPSCR